MTQKGFGHLLDESFQAYKGHFMLFLKVSFLLYFIPSVVFGIVFLYMPNVLTKALVESLRVIVSSLLSLLLTFTVIKILLLKRTKKELEVKEAIVEGSKHFGKGVLLSFVMGFALLGLFICLIVPGIIFSVYWTFAYYAFITDGKGVIESMNHSKKVVEGRWWKVLGYMLLITLIVGGLSLVVIVPAYMAIGVLLVATRNALLAMTLLIALGSLVEMILVPFMMTFMEKFYLDLKHNTKH